MTSEVAEPRSVYSVAGAAVGDLPDVNVWLAMAVQEHPHHAAAHRYWEQGAGPRLWFNRVTMLALVRLLCQPRVMGDAAMRLPQALEVYRRFVALPEVGIAPEDDACEQQLERLVVDAAVPARLWTDAYLAAFATSAGLRLVTFDADFERFDGLRCLRLAPAGSA